MLNVLTWPDGLFFVCKIIFLLILCVFSCKTFVQLLNLRTSSIPVPKGSLIFGHLWELRSAKDAFTVLEKWTREFGPVLRFRPLGLFGREFVLVGDPEAAKQILVKNCHKYERSAIFKTIFPLAEDGLFSAIGKEHSRQKKVIAPAFNIANLKGLFDVFQRKTELLIKLWSDAVNNDENESNEGNIFIHKGLSRLTLDVIGECAFGYQFNSLSDEENIIASSFETLLQGTNRDSNPLRFIPILKHIPTNARRKENFAMGLTDDIIMKVIEKKISGIKNPQECSTPKRQDLIDRCIKTYDEEYGEKLNMKELRSQVFTFMLAGHETTSAAMSWTLYFLAEYPEIQENVRREIKEKLKDNELTWDTFESMEYLTAVMNESLRLCPPVGSFTRTVIKEDDILGHKVTPGTTVLLAPYLIHRHSGYWKDSKTFNPDRFLSPDRDENPPHRFAFLPFSSGPRMCIGYKFAMIEMKVVLSMLLQRFAFSPVPGLSFYGKTTITYKPKPSLQLLVRSSN